MARNPGIIFKMPDGRLCIFYNNQPALKQKGKVVLMLVDEKYNPIIKDGKATSLIRDLAAYKEEIKTWTTIGFID